MVKKQKLPRSEEFLAGKQALRMSDLTPQEQKVAVSLISDQTKGIRKGFRKVAGIPKIRTMAGKLPNAHELQKAKKAKLALSDAVNKPFTMEGAVESRVKYITNAANMTSPGEDLGGAGFYFEHRRDVEATIEGTGVPLLTALDAASKLSVRTSPKAEKASLKALIDAHRFGTVSFTPELTAALHSVRDRGGEQTVSPKMTAEHEGKTVPFADIHPVVAARLTTPSIRNIAKRHVQGVDLDGLAKTAITKNISGAHEVMQGTPSSAFTNPKQISYAAAHEVARPDTPEIEEEYMDRARKIGESLRTGMYQESFDFHNLRSSNEGALSNRASTPADLWEQRISYDQPGKAFTSASDAVGVPKKSRTLPSGKTQSVGYGEKNITGIGIMHAVHQEAVHQTADKLQKDLNLNFTVPALLVQETDWAGGRRTFGQDPSYSVAANVGQQFAPDNSRDFNRRAEAFNKSIAKGKTPESKMDADGQGTFF